ncbi:MAG: DUF6588 family protein [Mucilaginibacter sp.]
MKKSLPLLVIIASVCITSKVSAQSGFSDLIKSGPGDATKLVNAYAEPLFKGFGVGMNSGWSNTAKAKKLLHFDIRISATGALVPASDKNFDVSRIGLSNHVRPADPNATIAPTIGGERSTQGPTLNVYDDQGNKVSEFNTPSGKLPLIPAPQVQITIGLPKNTDITVRGIPSINFGSNAGSVSMIGFGVKHDIIQDFVGKRASKLIPFDLAIALGYSRLNSNIPLNVQPDEGAQPVNGQQSTDFSNQHISAHFNSFIAQAIISKQLLFFTPFLSVGYNTASVNAAALGNYPVTTNESFIGQPVYTTFPNPIKISERSISGMRADVGFQLNLAVFRIYASYSAAQYQSINAGIGFGF